MRFSLSLVVVVLLIAGCKSTDTTTTGNNAPARGPGTAPTAPAANASAVKSRVDVCALLTSDELKSVQNESFANAMRSDRADGDFIVAQCYYAMPTAVNSVVLNVTTAKEASGAPNPRDFWERTFGKEAGGGEKEREKEKEKPAKVERERGEEGEGEAAAKPDKVAGLGDEAFWIGSRVGGALYVLKTDLFFRISVGGAGDNTTKLNKSKKLAQDVLKRL